MPCQVVSNKTFRYVRCLFETVFPPGIQFGIGFEAHQQNSVVRVCKETGHIKGFAIRDYGGIRIHKPTLRHHGISTDWEIPGGIMLTDDLSYVWDNFHHALFQNHISHLVYSLGLGDLGGWNIVREEVASVLKQYADEPNATQLLDFLMRETMNLKCFLRMRLEGIYRSVSRQFIFFLSYFDLKGADTNTNKRISRKSCLILYLARNRKRSEYRSLKIKYRNIKITVYNSYITP